MIISGAVAKRSLSTKLLLLTILFVLLAELLVMIPSIANERVQWFEARIEAAYLVSLALEGPRQEMPDEDVIRQLFYTANIAGVTINENNMRKLILAPQFDSQAPPDFHLVNLGDQMATTTMFEAWGTLFSNGDKLIQVTGSPRFAADRKVDIVVSQRALRSDLRIYARNILILSLIISILTAALVFWSLNRMIVKPVKELTRNIMSFQANPDQPERILRPSARSDELGAAEQSLAEMERSIHDLLKQRRRLAALGAGISKISHDLRNILASAQLMSDRLARSDDPRVRKLSPRLISALDRAITLSRDTLAFGRMEPSALKCAPVNIRALVDEVFDDTAALGVVTDNQAPEDLTVFGDRTQLYRSLFNLARNAVEAMTPTADADDGGASPNGAGSNGADGADGSSPPVEAGKITISARRTAAGVEIDIADTGPGVPDHARADLFEPFKGSQKPGGSGLGIAIAAEIVRAHNGDLSLVRSDSDGAVFRMTLPPGQAPRPGTVRSATVQGAVSTAPDSQTPSLRGSAPPS